jgi:hypothetical protein
VPSPSALASALPHPHPPEGPARLRSLFFKWLATKEGIPGPMTGLRPQHVPGKPAPSSLATSWPGWRAPAPAGASRSAATPRSSPSRAPPASGWLS